MEMRRLPAETVRLIHENMEKRKLYRTLSDYPIEAQTALAESLIKQWPEDVKERFLTNLIHDECEKGQRGVTLEDGTPLPLDD